MAVKRRSVNGSMGRWLPVGKLTAIVGAGCLCAALLLLASRAWASALGDTSIVRTLSGSLSAERQPLILPVQALTVTHLGAATVLVSYDPAVVQASACQRNPAFDVGLCNIHYDADGDGVSDAVLFNLVSVNGLNASSDPLLLVQLTWQAAPTLTESASTTLSITVRTFTDIDAAPLPVLAQNGQLTVDALPTSTPTATPTMTPTATPTETPTPTATPTPRVCWHYLPLLLAQRPAR